LVAGVWGRDRELAAVERFLDGAAVGLAALLLKGSPGMGKTSLWAVALAGAAHRGYRVLQSRPAESEARLAFASLSDLLADVSREYMHALPAPQCQALEAALLRAGSTGATVDRRSVSMAVLGVLRSLSEQGPVLIAIDDWQWVDPPSLHTLEFVLRRLHGHRLGAVITVRTGSSFDLGRELMEGQVEQVELGPLNLTALRHMLADRLHLLLPRPAVMHLERTSGGNPLFALEIGRAIVRTGSLPKPGEPLPVPDTLREAVRARLAVLPQAVRRALLILAASGRPTLALLRQLRGEKANRELRAAVVAGIVDIARDERIRFTHPLLSAVILASASPVDRSSLYRRLAQLASDPDERAAYLASSGATAADLNAIDAGARSAALRGAPDIAAELGEHTLALIPADRPEELLRRQTELAWYHFQAGNAARSRELLAAVVPAAAPGLTRARALWRLGQLRSQQDSCLEAAALFTRALADAGGDARLLAELERDTALALIASGQVTGAEPHARAALEHAQRLGDHRLVIAATAPLALVRFFAGEGLPPGLASPVPDDLYADDLPVGMRPNVLLSMVLRWSDRFDAARRLLEAEHRRVIERGCEHEVPGVVWHLSELECWTGNWELAAGYAEAGKQAALLGATEPALALAHYVSALMHACRGAVEDARKDAAAGLEVANASGLAPVAALIHHVLGFLELSLGDATAAHGWLAQLDEAVTAMGFEEPCVLRFLPDAAEALIGIGDLAQASRLLGPFENHARALKRIWALAAAARCRGLLLAAAGDLAGAVQALDRALAYHAEIELPLERGRTLLATGRVHRRRREKRRAREALEGASRIFNELGAQLWARRAHAELARIGLRPPSAHELSQTETQVARLAADGLTNRQIASALFLSPRSVDGVIARIYQKLGIRSRAELGSRMAVHGSALSATRASGA
jgi:DNA-binding CsgD family transcriptional regulator